MFKKGAVLLLLMVFIAGCSSKGEETKKKEEKKTEKTEETAKSTSTTPTISNAEQLSLNYENDLGTIQRDISSLLETYNKAIATPNQVNTTVLQQALDSVNQTLNDYNHMPLYENETKHQSSREVLKEIMSHLTDVKQNMTNYLTDTTNSSALDTFETYMRAVNNNFANLNNQYAQEQGDKGDTNSTQTASTNTDSSSSTASPSISQVDINIEEGLKKCKPLILETMINVVQVLDTTNERVDETKAKEGLDKSNEAVQCVSENMKNFADSVKHKKSMDTFSMIYKDLLSVQSHLSYYQLWGNPQDYALAFASVKDMNERWLGMEVTFTEEKNQSN